MNQKPKEIGTYVTSGDVEFLVHWYAWKDDYEIRSVKVWDSALNIFELLSKSVDYDIKCAIEHEHEGIRWSL